MAQLKDLSVSGDARIIGNLYDNNPRIGFGTCSTAADTAIKVVVINDPTWTLKIGNIIGVHFTNTNTAALVKLNVNNSGAIHIAYDTDRPFIQTDSNVCGYADRTLFYQYDGEYWQWISAGYGAGSGGGGDSVPIGALSSYIGTTAPEGYLLCQGQKVSKTTYPELYAICGTTFGPETTTEFTLPDLRGQVIAGYKQGDATFGTLGALIGGKTTAYTPAGKNTGTAVTLNAVELTHSGGAVQGHKLTAAESGLPSHTHTLDGWAHGDGKGYSHIEGSSLHYFYNQVKSMSYAGGTDASSAHSHGFTQPSKHSFTPTTKTITQPTFTGTAANISTVQPTIILNWIVKAKKIISLVGTVVNEASTSETDAYSCKYINDNYTKSTSLATVATSGSYNDLSSKPTIPTVVNNVTSTSTTNALSANMGKSLNDTITIMKNIPICVGSQVIYEYKDTGTTSGKVGVLGAYEYSLFDGVTGGISCPSGYHFEYRLSAQMHTADGGYIQLFLNNIGTSQVTTYSSLTFRKIATSNLFKLSDITLETTLGYASPGCNLYYKSTSNSAHFYDVTISAYIVKD